MITRRALVTTAVCASALAGFGRAPVLAGLDAASGTFPFTVLPISTDNALEEAGKFWAAGSVPIITGPDDKLSLMKRGFESPDVNPVSELAATLKRAGEIRFPEDLRELRYNENKAACEALTEQMALPGFKLPEMFEPDADNKQVQISPDEVRQRLLAGCTEQQPPNLDEWPEADSVEEVPTEALLTALIGEAGNGNIIVVPTDDWTKVPALLRWGGWNSNPLPEYHIAAWRSWRDRYGAKLLGMTDDTLIMTVERPPSGRKEAYQLAEEQYIYCSDIVDQGVGTIPKLAAGLVSSKFWYFWWD